jgi:hypothetical protein
VSKKSTRVNLCGLFDFLVDIILAMENQVADTSLRFFQFPLRGMRWIYRISPTPLQFFMEKLRPLRGVVLAVVFFLSFAAPISLGYYAVRLITAAQDDVKQTVDPLPGAVRFSAQGMYGKIINDARLTPNSTLPYLFSGWFKMSQLPAVGQRIMLMARFNPHSAVNEGMALGVSRDAIGYRPVVYWRSASGAGGWYQFERIALRSRVWFQLGLSFREGRLLGLHGVADIDDLASGVQLLGGYELAPETYPSTSMDMVFGAYGQNPFRGFVGPIAVFSGEEVGRDIHGVLKRLMRSPEELPDLIPDNSVVVRGYLGEQLQSALGIRSEVVRPVKKQVNEAAEATAKKLPVAPTKDTLKRKK